MTAATLALVTGANGWLGRRLVQALVQGEAAVAGLGVPSGGRSVRCLVLPGSDTAALAALGAGVQIVEGDVRDAASLAAFFGNAGGATLFHVAGLIHPSGRTRELFRVNRDGTRHVVDGAIAAGARRMVHVSSNSPMGVNASPEALFDESAPFHPYMKYGRSKMLAEEIVNEAGRAGRIETVIIRPPWFYGPGQPPRQTQFFSMIRDGKGPIVGSGENRRSMAYVDNICQGLLLCESTARANGQTYWIADRRAYSMTEIIDTVERLLEKEFGFTVAHRRLRLPHAAGQIAGLVDGLLQGVGLYHQKIHVLSEMNKTIACTVAKAERELGYDPQIDLEEGMRRSIAWILSSGGGIP